jgi:hypothetical protein
MILRKFAPLLLLTLALCWFVSPALAAQKAYYHPNADRLFWFMILSDTHVGADNKAPVNTAAENLAWAVGPARQAIMPLFIVNTGDLCDSTDGGMIPNGPHQDEWEMYRQILLDAGMTPDFYYDMPGNHDQYNDKDFVYYKTYSMQGQATGSTQPSWTRQFPYGSYHFKGACTPGNDGVPWSMSPDDNFGDHAGLDTDEIADLGADLDSHKDDQLVLLFGHHPFEPCYSTALDTGLQYGVPLILALIDQYHLPFYGFGHTHNYRENFRTGFYFETFADPGLYYMNMASLGKESEMTGDYKYAVMAIDGNGISFVPAQPHVWPVVMITAPVDRSLGTNPNPYAYEVPPGRNNPIRALVFDEQPVSQVQFAIDGSAAWQDMQKLEGKPIWEGRWNAAMAAPGAHTIAVRAQGSTTVTKSSTTYINRTLLPASITPMSNLLLSD